MSYFDHRVIKTAFGTFLAIYLAQIMGISYGAVSYTHLGPVFGFGMMSKIR